jgi:putative transposase
MVHVCSIVASRIGAAGYKLMRSFASIHASVHNHFNQERHLYNRENFKLNRTAALSEWRQLAA